jgi:hypothetical protein
MDEVNALMKTAAEGSVYVEALWKTETRLHRKSLFAPSTLPESGKKPASEAVGLREEQSPR